MEQSQAAGVAKPSPCDQPKPCTSPAHLLAEALGLAVDDELWGDAVLPANAVAAVVVAAGRGSGAQKLGAAPRHLHRSGGRIVLLRWRWRMGGGLTTQLAPPFCGALVQAERFQRGTSGGQTERSGLVQAAAQGRRRERAAARAPACNAPWRTHSSFAGRELAPTWHRTEVAGLRPGFLRSRWRSTPSDSTPAGAAATAAALPAPESLRRERAGMSLIVAVARVCVARCVFQRAARVCGGVAGGVAAGGTFEGGGNLRSIGECQMGSPFIVGNVRPTLSDPKKLRLGCVMVQ